MDFATTAVDLALEAVGLDLRAFAIAQRVLGSMYQGDRVEEVAGVSSVREGAGPTQGVTCI